MKLELGLGAIRSFKRLSYTPWHALAEFVDNSTQSYRSHQVELDAAYNAMGTGLTVDIEYDADGGTIRIHDNAMGMSLAELTRALVVGELPPEPRWRSQFGFGLKTAASWFGDLWTVETKRLGERKGLRVVVDVERVASGEAVLPVEELDNIPESDHFTTINISRLNRPLRARTRTKIAEFLSSMYRDDLRRGSLRLRWNRQELTWDQYPKFATTEAGKPLRHEFEFDIRGKRVSGWAGVLARGSRAKAGFSMLHASRVIKGWPEAWRPQEIFGQLQGSNDLVNQRLVGEIYLDAFAVSQTKDDILWLADEEQEVEFALRAAIADLIKAARERRPTKVALPVPSEVRRAATAIQRFLTAQNVRELWLHGRRPPDQELRSRAAAIVSRATRRAPDFTVTADGLNMAGYLGAELVPEDEYLVSDTGGSPVNIVINMNHPYIEGMRGDSLQRHVEHCVFDALSQWRAHRTDASPTNGLVVTFFKDGLLRLDRETAASDSKS